MGGTTRESNMKIIIALLAWAVVGYVVCRIAGAAIKVGNPLGPIEEMDTERL